ncbi:MAG: undecaprenyldiphospho-muramoylpentapeptide beta-N-acetylglucosaminyltransferase [Alphaproteobacteria bacterium]|nr:undecaprenyldiphospho-muramoylpentapeptide beta-N-acetylglucosaminyltransferase [Alphaproteobacteria bacterium]
MTKEKRQDPLIILTAGGTGGHVYPAESLAEELSLRGYKLMLITDKRGKDNYKGKLGEITNYSVLSGGIVGKSRLFKIKSIFKTCIGIIQAMWIIHRKKPACIVGFGGYASFPACMGAVLSGTPLIIHEQNSVMSRTNRFLSKYAEFTAQSFRNVKYSSNSKQNIFCGMPVRTSIAQLTDKPYPQTSSTIQILVLGGSQGAKIFGEIIPQSVKGLPDSIKSRLKIYQQCRKGEEASISQIYSDYGIDHTVSSFFENMSEIYSQTHIIISRAGASSVSELTVAGIPSILVPLPTAADNHQEFNATEISSAGAGKIILQKDFTPQTLQSVLEEWCSNPQKLQQMSLAAHRIGISDAATRLANLIESRVIINRGE